MKDVERFKDDPLFYTPREVQLILRVSRGYIYKLIETKGFPKPVHMSARCRRFPAKAVDEWVAQNLRNCGEAA